MSQLSTSRSKQMTLDIGQTHPCRWFRVPWYRQIDLMRPNLSLPCLLKDSFYVYNDFHEGWKGNEVG
jgi:hypothetical protein